jgi:hypothetical protein
MRVQARFIDPGCVAAIYTPVVMEFMELTVAVSTSTQGSQMMRLRIRGPTSQCVGSLSSDRFWVRAGPPLV